MKFFEPHVPDGCALCGSIEKPTGEHKIKASILERELGSDALYVGTTGSDGKFRLAQSAKSKFLKFKSRLCEACNTSRTQPADMAFDLLHEEAREIATGGGDPSDVFASASFEPTSEAYLNAFRYFAKLLCCHLAEVGAPRFIPLAGFATGETSTNRVWLQIRRDPTFHAFQQKHGVEQYAAHGGLIVYGDKTSGAPNGFHTSLTAGPVQYVFWTRLNLIELLDLRFRHRRFYDWCVEMAKAQAAAPISDELQHRLGLKDDSKH